MIDRPSKVRLPKRGVGDYVLVVVALAATALIAHSLGGSWTTALVIGGILAFGLYLWLGEQPTKFVELGQGILVSCLVAIAFLFIQQDTQEKIRDLEEDRDKADKRQSLRLTLGLQGDLSGIDLSKQDLRGFVLSGKTMTGASLDHASFDKAILSGADLTNASVHDVSFHGAVLTDGDLSRATVVKRSFDVKNRETPEQVYHELIISKTSFEDAVLDRAILRNLDLRKVRFGGASLRDAKLTRSDLSGADLRGANLTIADLTGADLGRANLAGADLRQASVCALNLGTATLTGAKFNTKTTWPQGFDPRAAGARALEHPLKSAEGVEIHPPEPARCH